MVRSSFAAVLSLVACVRPVEPPAPSPVPVPSSVAPTVATASPLQPEPEAAPTDAGTPYDFVIAGGRVIDPAGGRDGIFDVAVAGGRIAAVAPSIDASRARAVIHAEGLLVTPGLVDIHTHVFHGPESKHYLSGSPLAVLPDDFAPSSCTTTVVDAGSSGHRTFSQLREQILVRGATRALAFVNIVGLG